MTKRSRSSPTRSRVYRAPHSALPAEATAAGTAPSSRHIFFYINKLPPSGPKNLFSFRTFTIPRVFCPLHYVGIAAYNFTDQRSEEGSFKQGSKTAAPRVPKMDSNHTK